MSRYGGVDPWVEDPWVYKPKRGDAHTKPPPRSQHSDFVEGMTPVNYELKVGGGMQGTTLRVDYLVTDVIAAQKALTQAMDTQQGMFPGLAKPELRKKLHLPAVEESPLIWLDRRVNEICKQGRKRYG